MGMGLRVRIFGIGSQDLDLWDWVSGFGSMGLGLKIWLTGIEV